MEIFERDIFDKLKCIMASTTVCSWYDHHYSVIQCDGVSESHSNGNGRRIYMDTFFTDDNKKFNEDDDDTCRNLLDMIDVMLVIKTCYKNRNVPYQSDDLTRDELFKQQSYSKCLIILKMWQSDFVSSIDHNCNESTFSSIVSLIMKIYSENAKLKKRND